MTGMNRSGGLFKDNTQELKELEVFSKEGLDALTADYYQLREDLDGIINEDLVEYFQNGLN